MRPYDGHSDEALADPTVDCRELITGADFDGEEATFWCRGIVVKNDHAADDAVLSLYDQNEGVAVAANQKGSYDIPAATTVFIEFPAPGKSFLVNIVAGLDGAVGTVNAYDISASGYLTGGM